jgi:hypothetical protein
VESSPQLGVIWLANLDVRAITEAIHKEATEMGYYVKQLHSDIFIAAKDLPEVHKSIVNLANETHRGRGGVFQGGKEISRHFAFVDTADLAAAKTAEDAFKAWSLESDFDDEGNLTYLHFSSPKLGQEDIMLSEIAPWVKDGSFILMAGEEGYIWRWYFKDGKCLEQPGIIFFKTDDQGGFEIFGGSEDEICMSGLVDSGH